MPTAGVTAFSFAASGELRAFADDESAGLVRSHGNDVERAKLRKGARLPPEPQATAPPQYADPDSESSAISTSERRLRRLRADCSYGRKRCRADAKGDAEGTQPTAPSGFNVLWWYPLCQCQANHSAHANLDHGRRCVDLSECRLDAQRYAASETTRFVTSSRVSSRTHVPP